MHRPQRPRPRAADYALMFVLSFVAGAIGAYIALVAWAVLH